jgi:hypothetical protein
MAAGPARRDKIRLRAYPCRERGGVVWAYMGQAQPAAEGGVSSGGHLEDNGPVSDLPPLPELEWTLVSDSQRCVSKRLQDCNYLQALEGGIDLSHLSFLHVYLDPERDRLDQQLVRRDPQPRFEVVDTEYGLIIGARRDVDEESQYWRISHWLMPWYTSFPPLLDSGFGAHAWVPIDDEHCWAYSVTWDPEQPILVEQREGGPAGEGIYGELLPGTFRPKANKDNDYLVDRAAQRTQSFTGIPGFAAQDCAAQESMGPIWDRTREHLGTTDVPLVALRWRLLQGLRDLQAGREPFGLDAASYRVRPAALSLPKTVPLQEGLKLPSRPSNPV